MLIGSLGKVLSLSLAVGALTCTTERARADTVGESPKERAR